MDKYTCSNNIPSKYFLDDDNIYKPCYYLCNSCRKSGNDSYHNCDTCTYDYKFINESSLPRQNCYKECDAYYYLDSSHNYGCAQICRSTYNKIIGQKKKCIDDCKNDDEYKYEYNNKCLKQCPDNTKIYEAEKICLEECYEYQFEYNNKCYNSCPRGTLSAFKTRYICMDTVPANYYLDNSDNIYKECYNTCGKCIKSGNDINNNCDECINGYIYIDESSVPQQNCFKTIII